MASLTESVDVNSDIHTVYNQWTQFETFKEFIKGIDKISQLDDIHTHWVVTVAGAQREFDTEITEQHPDERVAWKSTGGTVHAGVVTFHRLDDDQTRLTAQIDWDPDGVVEKAGAMLNVDNAQVKSALRQFKSFVESRGGETGSWRGEVDPPHAR